MGFSAVPLSAEYEGVIGEISRSRLTIMRIDDRIDKTKIFANKKASNPKTFDKNFAWKLYHPNLVG